MFFPPIAIIFISIYRCPNELSRMEMLFYEKREWCKVIHWSCLYSLAVASLKNSFTTPPHKFGMMMTKLFLGILHVSNCGGTHWPNKGLALATLSIQWRHGLWLRIVTWEKQHYSFQDLESTSSLMLDPILVQQLISKLFTRIVWKWYKSDCVFQLLTCLALIQGKKK